jgi:hypothetical protein
LTSEVFVRSPHKADRSFPRNLEHINFVLWGLGYAWSDLPFKEYRHDFSALISKENNPEFIFAYQDLDAGLDALDSWLNDTTRYPLARELLGEANAFGSSEAAQKALEETLKTEPKQDLVWGWIKVAIGNFVPHPSLRALLEEKVVNTNFVQLTSADSVSGMEALLTACKIAHHLGTEVLDYLHQQLKQLAQHLASKYPRGRGEEVEGVVSTMVECTLFLNAGDSVTEHQIENFVAEVLLLTHMWPSLGGNLRYVIQRFCEELPPAQAKIFWPLLLQLRTNP